MVSYDSLFQYTLVLLTVILVTLALIKRKKQDQPPCEWWLIISHYEGDTAVASAVISFHEQNNTNIGNVQGLRMSFSCVARFVPHFGIDKMLWADTISIQIGKIKLICLLLNYCFISAFCEEGGFAYEENIEYIVNPDVMLEPGTIDGGAGVCNRLRSVGRRCTGNQR